MNAGNFAELASTLKKLQQFIAQQMVRLWKTLKTKPYLVLLFVAIFTYGIVFSYFTVLKHNVFQSYAWDLGIFNQAMYTTLHEGKLFYYTAELYFSQSGSYFAVHFSPILFLALPFYAISSSPTTLLVIQAFSLGLGAIPLYLLAKELLKNNKSAFIIAIIYLLYPALQAANWFDFHAPAFLPFFFFSMCYLMVTRRWKLYFPCVLLTLMIQEQVAFAVFMIGAFYFVKSGHLWSLFKGFKPLRVTENFASIITLFMCTIYYLFSGYVRNSFPINPEYVDLLKATSSYSVLGLKGDPLLFPVYIALNPQNAINALMYDFPIKLLYLLFMFGPLLFIPFRSKIVIGVLALLCLFLFSNYSAYYELGNQYPLYVLPLIFVALIYGLRKIKNNMLVLKIMLVITLLFTIFLSPLSPESTPLVNQGVLWYPPSSTSSNVIALNNLINLVPQEASVLTQNHIFPHVSSRINAYVLPLFSSAKDMTYLRFLINNSEYILIDLSTEDPITNFVLNDITQNNSYRVSALSQKAVLFKRDFQDKPIFTYSLVFTVSNDLNVGSGRVLSDTSLKSGVAALSQKGLNEGILTYGPYIDLPNGNFSVVFRVRTSETSQNATIGFDVCSGTGTQIFSNLMLNSSQIKDGSWFEVTLPFSISRLTSNIEFRTSSNGLTSLYVDTITLVDSQAGM